MLVDFQNAFVRIVTDARSRQRFFRDPDELLADFSLGEQERAALRALPRDAIERYAHSLVAKRWDQVQRIVPLTLRVCPHLGVEYRAWALEHPARVSEMRLSPGAAEALRAHDALRSVLDDESQASYAADLWSFEVLRAAARGDGQARTLASRFPIVEIAREIESGLLPIDPAPDATEVVFDGPRVRWRRRCS
ncbi:MAG: hypothetical protein HOV81_22670 [Kofleriaceae bacterium]|nr:hypothetical protein [Kofleriaceae bacterium]